MKRRIRIPIGVSSHYEKDRVRLPFICIEFPPKTRMPEVKEVLRVDAITGDDEVAELPGPLSKAVETVIDDVIAVVSTAMAPPPPVLLLSWVFWEDLPSKALFTRIRERLLQGLAPFIAVILEEYDRGEDPFKEATLQDRADSDAFHDAATLRDPPGPISPFDEDALGEMLRGWMEIHRRLEVSEHADARMKDFERGLKPTVLEVVSSSDPRVKAGSIFTLRDRLPNTIADIIACIEAEETD